MCDFCENIKEHNGIDDHDLKDGIIQYSDKKSEYLLLFSTDSIEWVSDDLKINFCPLCGRKLSEETEHSGSIRQIIKEVAEGMQAPGKYDGDYAFPYGMFGYMDGLYHVDLSCSNCGKRHEGVVYGTEIVCSCGKKIKTGSRNMVCGK